MDPVVDLHSNESIQTASVFAINRPLVVSARIRSVAKTRISVQTNDKLDIQIHCQSVFVEDMI